MAVLKEISLKSPLVDQDGKSHDKLVIQEPTTSQYIDFGDIYNGAMDASDGAGQVHMIRDAKVGIRYLESCTGIHEPFLVKLPIFVIRQAIDEIANFLGQTEYPETSIT